jgi:Lipid A 3-O-deacylase (PagL)
VKIKFYQRDQWQDFQFMAILTIMAVLAIGTAGSSQPDLRPPQTSFSIFAVGMLADASLQGTTSNRRLTLAGLSYRRVVNRNKLFDLSFNPEVIPLALLSEPFFKNVSFRGNPVQASRSIPGRTSSGLTYGAGAKPVALDLTFRRTAAIQPFIGVSGGFLYFTRNVLAFDASQFNFTIDGRAGVRIPFHGSRAISVAYMFQHMSNAYITPHNPGLDVHTLYVGYSFAFRHKAK